MVLESTCSDSNLLLSSARISRILIRYSSKVIQGGLLTVVDTDTPPLKTNVLVCRSSRRSIASIPVHDVVNDLASPHALGVLGTLPRSTFY